MEQDYAEPIHQFALTSDVDALKNRVTLLERRLNDWVNTKAEPNVIAGRRSTTRTLRPIASKYDGDCATCGERFYRTEPIFWQRVNGKSWCWHERCEAPEAVR